MKQHTQSNSYRPRQGMHKTAAWGLLGFGVLLMLDSTMTPMSGQAVWAQSLKLLVAILLMVFGIWVHACSQPWGYPLLVSGQHIYGFMVMKVQGPTLLTGGSFGIEASLIPVILGLLVSAAFLLCRGRETMIGSRT